jgi:hypothetical protein
MIAVLEGTNSPESDLSTQPLRDVLKDIWKRVKEVSYWLHNLGRNELLRAG